MIFKPGTRIGVDLDGTLAVSCPEDKYDPRKIGEPIPEMVDQVKDWIAGGCEVVIFTARTWTKGGVISELARKTVREWTVAVFGVELEVTSEKDPHMDYIFDDIAFNVKSNSGVICPCLDDNRDEADGIGLLVTE